ncbi:MAG TPA: sigma-70 family RNA polymerase sigma factor [Actinoplanes sp.]|nr:sigma-70 family RNA polymerase sigma factor [Actinoplanes sp.]
MSVVTCAPPATEPVRSGAAVREARMRVLFQVNARPLQRYLMRLTHGQMETAEDLLQETMLRAWRRMDELPSEAEPLRRWLFTVARNLTIDAARARLARPVEVSGEDVTWVRAPDDFLDTLLDRQVLRDALLQLTPEQRAVLVALYYRDASVAGAAAGIGIPEGTVRSRSFYALRAVREILARAA